MNNFEKLGFRGHVAWKRPLATPKIQRRLNSRIPLTTAGARIEFRVRGAGLGLRRVRQERTTGVQTHIAQDLWADGVIA